MTSKLLVVAVLVLMNSCKINYNEKDYLYKVLDNLDKIKSATYCCTGSASAPGDTLSFTVPHTRYIKEFVNSTDTFVGASSIQYNQEDTSKIQNFYDGLVSGKFNWDAKTIKVDSFQNNPYPFRLVWHPFYTKTKSIINYAIETEDSIRIDLKDFGDSVRFSLFIYDKVVEFVTKPFVNVNPYESSIGKISQYDIWIRKTDNLPYRMRRKMYHQTAFETCSDIILNTTIDENFISREYFPKDFTIVQFKRKSRNIRSKLEGTVATDWILKDIENSSIGLQDLKSKVSVIQFTGVGCGPCHESLPFVKQMVKDYENKDFEFVSIETWSKNIAGLKRYQEKNNFNFKFLKSEESVTKNYDVTSVPVFFILDENRVIRKVINGYRKETTDKVIIKTINELI